MGGTKSCTSWAGAATQLCGLRKIYSKPTFPSEVICLQLDRTHQYVALKVSVAEVYGKSRERKVMRILAGLDSGEAGSQHVMRFLDAFEVEGPNGKHECLVLELMGPSVSGSVEPYVLDPKLPGPTAKAVMHQALKGLAYLHKHNIGHGGTVTYS
jgi:serine/threonine-protein kinase SRPK3